MKASTILQRTLPAAALAVAFAVAGIGAASSARTESPVEMKPVAWFFYKHFSTQIACIAGIPAAIITTHADDVVCHQVSNGWDMSIEYA